ncbi:hypothetical protein E4U19_008187 [Claviceps sp. Clav32 group G5]|nr:hypothetical protein E4U19_008187 [Claviceps sp. Clav32 group G5]
MPIVRLGGKPGLVLRGWALGTKPDHRQPMRNSMPDGLKWMEKHAESLNPKTRRIMRLPKASALRESELPRLVSWTPEDLFELWKVNPAYEDAEKRNQMLDRKDKEER